MVDIINTNTLRELTGNKQSRNQALKRALDGNRASYGWLELKAQDGLLYVESNPFCTVINTDRVVQTEDGPSIEALGGTFDEVVVQNVNESVKEYLWNKQNDV